MPKKWFCINPTCNQIQNVTVYLVSQVCKDVMVEPPLQRLIGEGFYLKRWQIRQYRNQELLGSKCMEEKKTMQESRANGGFGEECTKLYARLADSLQSNVMNITLQCHYG